MAKLSAVCAMLMLVACVKVNGNLKVSDHLLFSKSSSSRDVVLAGDYKAQVSLKGRKKLTLKLESDFDKKKIKVKLPKGFLLPKEGSFSYKSKELNQPFDLSGLLSTTFSYGEVVTTHESCRIDNYGYCDYYYDYPRYGNYYGSYVTGPRPHYACYPVYGQRKVTYRMKTTKTGLDLRFVQEGKEKASFKGAQFSKDKEYSYVGPCLR